MSLKHFKSGTDEFIEYVEAYRENTLLLGNDSFEDSAIHNMSQKLKEISKFRVGQVDLNDQNETANKERSTTNPPIPKLNSAKSKTSSSSAKLVEPGQSTWEKPGPSTAGSSKKGGKFEAPKKQTIKVLLQNKQEITAAFCKKYKVAAEDFHYYHDSS